jgi:hypothetical protein
MNHDNLSERVNEAPLQNVLGELLVVVLVEIYVLWLLDILQNGCGQLAKEFNAISS